MLNVAAVFIIVVSWCGVQLAVQPTAPRLYDLVPG